MKKRTFKSQPAPGALKPVHFADVQELAGWAFSADVTQIKSPSREVWLQERTKGIGGSDISALLGLSWYRTEADVLRSKQSLAGEKITTGAMNRGNILEPLVSAYIAAGPHKNAVNLRSDSLFRSKARGWEIALATPDGFAIDEVKGIVHLLECKTTAKLRESLFQCYIAQMQWYMGLLGLDRGTLAVMQGRQAPDYWMVVRDEEFINIALETANDFWQRNNLGN